MSEINKGNYIKLCSNIEEDAKYLEIGCSKYMDYIQNLCQISKQINAPNICIDCWCFLTHSQIKSHKIEHKDSKRTPKQYCSEANFRALAEEKKHLRVIGDKKEIKILFFKPLGSTQIKNLPLTSTNVSQETLKETESKLLKSNPSEEKKSLNITEKGISENIENDLYNDIDDEILLANFLKNNREKLMKPNHLLCNKSDETKVETQKKDLPVIKETNLFTDILGKLNIITQGQEKIFNEIDLMKEENMVI